MKFKEFFKRFRQSPQRQRLGFFFFFGAVSFTQHRRWDGIKDKTKQQIKMQNIYSVNNIISIDLFKHSFMLIISIESN